MTEEMIVKHVGVGPKQAIDAVGIREFISPAVLETMPYVSSGEVDVYFFKVVQDPIEECKRHGFVPASPHVVIAINKVDAWAKSHSNFTLWGEGSVMFRCSDGERSVRVGPHEVRGAEISFRGWWLACVRK